MAIQITLPRIYASNHFGYAVSAKELYRALFPLPQSEQLKHGQIPFSQWLDHRVRFYGFEAGYDYALLEEASIHNQTENGSPDLSLSLNMAKELARLERTEHGRSVRYYLIDFEQDLSRGNRDNRDKNQTEKLDKKVKQLNQLAQSIKVGDNVMVVPTIDVVNLIKAIREYQTIADLYLKPEHEINPIWVNEVIEQLKYKTGKLLQDEQNNQLI